MSVIAPRINKTVPEAHSILARCGPWVAALIAVLTYACTLNGGYVTDDLGIIRADPRVTEARWRELWTEGYRVGGMDKLYRPLTSTTYAIEWRIHGDRPWAFHLVNILLHAAACFVVAMLARRIFGGAAGLISGVLFAVLPIHVEAVAAIVGRAEILCAIATIYGLCAFVSEATSVRLLVKLSVCFLVAVLSKEQGLLFPLLLLGAIPLRRSLGIPPADRSMRTWFLCLFLWLPALYLVTREHFVPMWWDPSEMAWEVNPIVRAHGLDRVLLPIVVLGHYVQLLLVPWKLSADYSGLVIGWKVRLADPYLYVGAAAALGIVVGGIWAIARRRWAVLFCLWGFAITYGLISNTVIVIGTLMAERLAYLPSAFLVILAASWFGAAKPRVWAPVLVLLTALGAARTVAYAVHWSDPFAFYQWTMRNQPLGKYASTWAFDADGGRGDWESARRIALRLRSIMPDSLDVHMMCIQSDTNLKRWADVKQDAELAEQQTFPKEALVPVKMSWTRADEQLRHLQDADTTRPSP